jgi:demethoxyubiquinone hydroxylase (CLK1/Coq7/Cat5 family)
MKKIFLLTGLIAASLFTGCTWKSSAMASPVDISKTDMTKVQQLKTGESCQKYLLFIPIGFDATAKTAAEKAGISHIEYQETTHTTFWPFYESRCIKVYGE